MVQDDIANDGDGKHLTSNRLTPQRYDLIKVRQHTVDVFCAGCDGGGSGMWELGSLVNAWEKVTGSRYMQLHDDNRKLKQDTIIMGESIAANKGTALEGWYGLALSFQLYH